MPKFVVVRGRDAWVIEEAIIEADNAAAAEEKARWKSEASQLDWVQTGDVRIFDDTEVMEGEARPLEEGETLEEVTNHTLTGEQRDIILAALRLWQDVMNDGGLSPVGQGLIDIATNGGAHDMLDADAIDELCEAINV